MQAAMRMSSEQHNTNASNMMHMEEMMELEMMETPGHRPESAPTRPSSAPIASSVSLPGGMPGPDYTGRIPYRSNIRPGSLSSHHSTVINPP